MHIKYNFTKIVTAYIIAIIIFIISAILIVYYSFGYRYDFANNQIETTGILHLSPTNTNLQILLDNQEINKNLIGNSTDITDLKPSKYQLKISQPEYLDWEKNITIEPNKITNENNIMLIPKTPKTSEISYIDQFSFNQYNQLLAYLSNNQIMILNFLSEKIQTIESQDINKSTDIYWINEKLLAATNKNPEQTIIRIINPYNNNISQVTVPHSINANNILGTMPLNESIIIYYCEPNLYLFDLTSSNPPREFIHDIYNPRIQNGILYYIPQTKNSKSIFAQNLTLQTTDQYDFIFPIENFDFIYNTSVITIHSENNQSYVFDLQNKKIIIATDHIVDVNYSPDNKKIAICKPNSIHIFSTENNITNESIIVKDQLIQSAIFIDSTNLIYESNPNLNRIDFTGQNNQTIEKTTSDQIIFANQQKILTIDQVNNQNLLKYTYLTH